MCLKKSGGALRHFRGTLRQIWGTLRRFWGTLRQRLKVSHPDWPHIWYHSLCVGCIWTKPVYISYKVIIQSVRYHQNHREIKYYVIYRNKYWSSQKSTFHVKMDLSLYACQGCPIAISHRVENRNWLVLVSLTRWRTNSKIISVSNRPVSWCPMSQGAPVSPRDPRLTCLSKRRLSVGPSPLRELSRSLHFNPAAQCPQGTTNKSLF